MKMSDALQEFVNSLGTEAINFLVALAILIIGYIVARIVGSIVRRLLKRTRLDNRLTDALSEPGDERKIEIEAMIAKGVFWLLMLFVLVAFFERLGLMGVATPIQTFLRGVTSEYLPRLGAAALLLFAAWLIATALKFLIKKGAALLKVDQRLTDYAALADDERVSLGDSLATAIFWFVLLLFLPSVLNALGIAAVAAPIQQIFNQIMGYIPNVLGAAVILLIGWFAARIIRRIVASLLNSVGVDKFGERLGLSEERPLSDLVGVLIYTFILLVTIISALEQLDIAAISEPTTQMLITIIDVIPALIGAVLVLVVSYAIARLVANLLKDVLSGIGLDSVPEKIGLK
jgi:hypothetical protein